MSCDAITPISAFQSTNLNSKIDSFNRLGERIVRSLGAPLVSVELHQDQIFENISLACEMFSKFAGYTKEYLIFDSNLYEKRKGIRLDVLYTLSNQTLSLQDKLNHKTTSDSTSPYLSKPDSLYIVSNLLSSSIFSSNSALSSDFVNNLQKNQILDKATFDVIKNNLTFSNFFSYDSVNYTVLNYLHKDFTDKTSLSSTYPNGISIGTILDESSYNILSSYSNNLLENYFCESKTETIVNPCANQSSEKTNIYSNMFDYDMMDYRKVISITDFEEGSTSGINTLFTIEQTLAQQTYFSYAMGNYGFDLISWWTVKNWLETREKVLAIRRSCEFDERTQYLKMYPEPTDSVRFYGALACYVERPLRDLIKEAWVYKYALALCKITLGTVRGKFGSTQAFGGQIFSQDMMQQGITERDALEQQLYTTSAGLGDADPVSFFIG